MSAPVTFHPVARVELLQAKRWYRERNQDAARAFARAVRRAIRFIADNPLACADQQDGTRRLLVRGFPYLIVYQPVANEIRVIAVAHTSRRPDYWATRPGS